MCPALNCERSFRMPLLVNSYVGRSLSRHSVAYFNNGAQLPAQQGGVLWVCMDTGTGRLKLHVPLFVGASTFRSQGWRLAQSIRAHCCCASAPAAGPLQHYSKLI